MMPSDCRSAAGGFLKELRMLDINKIMEILPHRFPFLMVDRVIEMDPGKKIVCVKNVTINEPFFQGHFPGHPVMPGVLIVEAMAQAGGDTCVPLLKRRDPPKGLLFHVDR